MERRLKDFSQLALDDQGQVQTLVKMTDDKRSRMSIAIMSRLQSTESSGLVPLHELEVSTLYLEPIHRSRVPAARFCGWHVSVGDDGKLTIGGADNSVWFKNAFIGKRFCPFCHSQKLRSQVLDHGEGRGKCKRCSRKCDYVATGVAPYLEYFGQEDDLDKLHVSKRGRLSRLADAHKKALLNVTEEDMKDLVLPSEVYVSRGASYPISGSLNHEEMAHTVIKWAAGHVLLTSRSPVTGTVEIAETVKYWIESEQANVDVLRIKVGEVDVLFDPSWTSVVETGQFVQETDELAVPFHRPEGLDGEALATMEFSRKKRYMVEIGEGSMLDMVPSKGTVDDRRLSMRRQRRRLFPVGFIPQEQVLTHYVDCRHCRLNEVQVVDIGVQTRKVLGGYELNTNVLVSDGAVRYDFFNAKMRDQEQDRRQERLARKRAGDQAKATKTRQAITMPEVEKPVVETEATMDEGAVVVDSAEYPIEQQGQKISEDSEEAAEKASPSEPVQPATNGS